MVTKITKKRSITTLLLILTLLLNIIAVPVYAADNNAITPYYNNVNSTSTNFIITDDGKATASIGYTGISGITSKSVITSYIQKKTLGIFWIRVDNGQPNKEWTDVSYNSTYRTSHSIQLSSKGEYRLVVEYEISGSGGSTDEISSTINRVYE